MNPGLSGEYVRWNRWRHRFIVQIIKRIHRGGKYEDTIQEAKENMKFIPELYKNVQKLVPEGAFYKFHDIWRLSTVKVSFLVNRLGIIGQKSSRGPCITGYFSVVW